MMRVLVACETSGVGRRAFAARGHDVWSCGSEQLDQRRDDGSLRKKQPGNPFENVGLCFGKFDLKTGFDVYEVALGGDLVIHQRSLFFGQRRCLPVGKACGDECLTEFQGIERNGGHWRPRVGKDLSNMAAKARRFKRPLTAAPNSRGVSPVTAKSVAGFDDPLVCRRSNCAPKARFSYVRAQREGFALPVPTGRFVNLLSPGHLFDEGFPGSTRTVGDPLMSAVNTLPESVRFQDTNLSIIDRNGTLWLSSADLARGLGYARADKVSEIYRRNSDEFTADMSEPLNLRVSGNLQKNQRIFSPRGCHLIAMFARTPQAKAFRKWVLDVLEQKPPQITTCSPLRLRGCAP